MRPALRVPRQPHGPQWWRNGRSSARICLAAVLACCGSGADSGQIIDPVPQLPALGANGLAFKRDGEATSTVATDALTTRETGSTLLACVGRGVVGAHTAPTDNKSNTFTLLGSAHTYTRFPNAGTACYVATNVRGGAGHVISAPVNGAFPFDETTLTAIEVASAGRVQAFAWNEDLASPLTSLSVTTTGPALLVAVWWGDGNADVAHMAVPNNGFTVVNSLLSLGALVQVAVATRPVTDAGTYNVTWTSAEGAQLYLFAVQR
jgi:hypothetical protein